MKSESYRNNGNWKVRACSNLKKVYIITSMYQSLLPPLGLCQCNFIASSAQTSPFMPVELSLYFKGPSSKLHNSSQCLTISSYNEKWILFYEFPEHFLRTSRKHMLHMTFIIISLFPFKNNVLVQNYQLENASQTFNFPVLLLSTSIR